MINARPGYWDLDRCSWVGVEPTYVVPPARPADHTHDRAIGMAAPPPDDTGSTVPAPRHRRAESPARPAT